MAVDTKEELAENDMSIKPASQEAECKFSQKLGGKKMRNILRILFYIFGIPYPVVEVEKKVAAPPRRIVAAPSNETIIIPGSPTKFVLLLFFAVKIFADMCTLSAPLFTEKNHPVSHSKHCTFQMYLNLFLKLFPATFTINDRPYARPIVCSRGKKLFIRVFFSPPGEYLTRALLFLCSY